MLMNVLFSLSCLIVVCSGLYDRSDDVVELTASNFNNLVINSEEVWLVEFYAPWCGHCKSLAPEWKKAAKALKGVVKVGAVDMDVHSSVGGPYNVRGFPTIKVFGSNKQSPSDYNGQRTASAIVNEAMNAAKRVVNDRFNGGGSSRSSSGGSSSGSGNKDAVVELTDSNFEKLVMNSKDIWLVEFFAPWCGHCQRLAPEWKKAAAELDGKVKLGAVDATVHTVMASRYQVQGYPTIKYFPAGVKDAGDVTDYDGGRTASDIVSWSLSKFSENLPDPEPVEIVSADVLKEACNEHPLCVISILPHILDCQAKCRNDLIKTLKEIGSKLKNKNWSYVWAEAGAQSELESKLGIGGFGYPAMAVVNVRKGIFATLRGSFSYEGIKDFLNSVSFGRGRTEPLAGGKLPEPKSRDPWDGKDGELPVEEEFDLSDIELEPLDEVQKTEL